MEKNLQTKQTQNRARVNNKTIALSKFTLTPAKCYIKLAGGETNTTFEEVWS